MKDNRIGFLLQLTNGRDYGLWPSFVSLVSISLALEEAILLAHSLAEVLKKRRKARGIRLIVCQRFVHEVS
jgi:hypothetical protein